VDTSICSRSTTRWAPGQGSPPSIMMKLTPSSWISLAAPARAWSARVLVVIGDELDLVAVLAMSDAAIGVDPVGPDLAAVEAGLAPCGHFGPVSGARKPIFTVFSAPKAALGTPAAAMMVTAAVLDMNSRRPMRGILNAFDMLVFLPGEMPRECARI
jgi:hypothetical protein